jgi:hypothetical protein
VVFAASTVSARTPPTQSPSAQASPAPHARLQAPQCASLAFGSTHEPPQDVRSPAQAHRLSTHTSPSAHGALHEPQCAVLAVVSTHEPSHEVLPAAQPQTPPLHGSLAPHGWLQLPQ